MASNPSIERAKLFAILQSENPTSLPVFVETRGEIQIVATGPNAGERKVVNLRPHRTYDLLQYATIDWWKTAASTRELSGAIDKLWLSVPTAGVAPTPSPARIPSEQLVDILKWLQTTLPQVSAVGQARMYFNGTSLQISENGGPYVNVVDPVTVSTITYGATVNFDFDPVLPVYRTMSLTGDVVFVGANYGPARQVSMRLVCDGSSHTLAFPAGWVFIGSSAPVSLDANKSAIISCVCYGANESDVIAAYSAEP